MMKHLEPFERFNKLDDKWAGPYIVRQCFDNGGFEIEDMDGKRFRYNASKVTTNGGNGSPGVGVPWSWGVCCRMIGTNQYHVSYVIDA